MDKPAEHVPQSRTVSMSQDIAAHEPAPEIPHRSVDHSRGPSMHSAGQDRTANDVWTSAISRLQAQVSYNTGMLESHRRQFTEIEAAIGRLNQQMGEVVHAVNDVQRELRVRPIAAEQLPRHDSGDLEVLAGQLQRLTNRVNEVDGMNMQLDLVKNRVKRLEEGGAAVASTQHRSLTATYSREQATQDTPASMYSQQQHQQKVHHYQPQQQAPQLQQHAPLPRMRTASMASPGDSRSLNFPGPGTLESQGAHPLHPSSESRPFSAEQPPSASQFQPNETLPPPSALSGWRPAEHHGLPAIRSSNDHQPRPLATAEPDVHPMHSSQAGGWAAVNTNAAIKRPPDDRASPYQSPSLQGPKRPRLAPLMPSSAPRSIQTTDAYNPAQFSLQSMAPNPAEVPFHPRSRAPSDGSQSRSAATPGPSSGQHSFRFITSAQQADGSPEIWRPEMAGGPPPQQHAPPPPPGRGGGRRGGGRGRGRGRGRGGGGGADRHGSGHEGQEHGTPEWERPDPVTGHSSPNSGCQSIHPHSPKSAYRSTPGERGGGFLGGPPEKQNEFPATPVNPGSPHDSYTTAQPDATSGSSGKKTRTKPIRNADGILIRKDGRPDMRSVSSANNLRKVHAKKEAERGDGDDDGNELTRSGTPTSAAAAGAGEDLSDEHGSETQERNRELISRIYAHQDDTHTQDRYSATHEVPRSVPAQSETGSMCGEEKKDDSHMAEVVMQDSQAQAEDTKHFAAFSQQEHPVTTAASEDQAIAA